jgi:hypothetical protein
LPYTSYGKSRDPNDNAPHDSRIGPKTLVTGAVLDHTRRGFSYSQTDAMNGVTSTPTTALATDAQPAKRADLIIRQPYMFEQDAYRLRVQGVIAALGQVWLMVSCRQVLVEVGC